MDKITYNLRKMVKNNKFLMSICIIIIFGIIFSSTFNIVNVYAETFSADLENEDYTPEILITSGWYDGIWTGWFDSIGQNPLEWGIYEGSSCDVSISSGYSTHTRVLSIYDNSASAYGSALYYLPEIRPTSTQEFDISFWITQNNVRNTITRLYLDNNDRAEMYLNTGNLLFRVWDDSIGSFIYSSIGASYTAGNWYFIRFIVRFDVYTSFLTIYCAVQNSLLQYVQTWGFTQFSDDAITTLDYFEFISEVSQSSYYSYLDALSYSYNSIISKESVLGYETYSEIQDFPINHKAGYYINSYEINNALVFSLYNSIISQKANRDNNYRNTFITDNFFNSELLNCSRVLRLKGGNIADNKYKVIQLYLDDLDNPNAFFDNENQSIYVRIDAFDNSDYLIHKLYFNLDFSSTAGYIYWYWYGRESIAIPRFLYNSHNPTFSFVDYLYGATLKQLEVSFHFFLTYNSTNMLLAIRTNIAFNLNHSSVYCYDKIIDLGLRSSFLGNQDELIVKYIDYFNRNNGTDYLGYREYTYNNLAGVRTLQVNNTGWYFNFLQCGYFTDVIDFPIPPNPPPIPDDLNPTEPEGYFWYYNSVNIKFSENFTITVYNLTWNYPFVELYSHTSKYPLIWISTAGMDNWGLFGEWNWLRNGLIALFNIVIATPINLLGYVLTLAWNYVVVFLIVGMTLLFIINVIGLLICYGITWLVWSILSVWQYLLLPSVLWILQYGIPTLIAGIIFLASWLIGFIIWLFTLCTGDLGLIVSNISTILTIIADQFIELITIFIVYLPYFIIWIFIYLYLLGLLYCKYLYFRFKGWNSEADELMDILKTFLKPISFIVNQIAKLRGNKSND